MYTYLFGQRHLELRFPPFAWFLRIRENNMVTPKKEQGREGKKERKKPRRHATHRVCVCVCVCVYVRRDHTFIPRIKIYSSVNPFKTKANERRLPFLINRSSLESLYLYQLALLFETFLCSHAGIIYLSPCPFIAVL